MTTPWIKGVSEPSSGERWLVGQAAGGPVDQFLRLSVTRFAVAQVISVARGVLFRQASRTSTARPFAVVQDLAPPIGQPSRSAQARPIVVDQRAPLRSYPEEVMQDAPDLYWRLDQLGDAYDHTGNGRIGTLRVTADANYDGAQTTVAGAVNGGVRMHYADFLYEGNNRQDTFASTDTSWSLEGWVQFTMASAPSNFYLVWQVGFSRRFGLFGSNLRVEWGSSNSHKQTIAPLSEINDGSWRHIVVTADAPAMRVCAYIDGALRNEWTNVSIPTQSGNSAITPWWGPTTGLGDPILDELAYYGHALTADQVKRHYDSATKGPPAPVSLLVPVGRAVSTRLPRAVTALSSAPTTVHIKKTSVSTSAQSITPQVAGPPGPMIVPFGTSDTTSLARSFTVRTLAPQAVFIPRATRLAVARTLSGTTSPTFHDTFNRPSGSLGEPDKGGPYTIRSGSFLVSEETALRGGNTTDIHVVTFPVPSAFDATITVTGVGTNSGFLWHYQDLNNFWLLNWTPDIGLTLHRCIAGTFRQWGAVGPAVTIGSTVRVMADALVYRVDLNGRPIFHGTNEDFPNATTTAGYRFNKDTSSRWDEVAVRAITSVGASQTGGVPDVEVAAVVPATQGLIYKGRDVRIADEGAMA